MKAEDFDALLKRREELQEDHLIACEVLEEEPHPANLKKCARLYDELAAIQQKIDDHIAAERAADNAQT